MHTSLKDWYERKGWQAIRQIVQWGWALYSHNCILIQYCTFVSCLYQWESMRGVEPQSTYIYRVQSSVWRLQTIGPPPPVHPASVSSTRTKGGGGEGLGGSILMEDARHWIGLLNYNPSTGVTHWSPLSPPLFPALVRLIQTQGQIMIICVILSIMTNLCFLYNTFYLSSGMYFLLEIKISGSSSRRKISVPLMKHIPQSIWQYTVIIKENSAEILRCCLS